jgi:hypothetical protein
MWLWMLLKAVSYESGDEYEGCIKCNQYFDQFSDCKEIRLWSLAFVCEIFCTVHLTVCSNFHTDLSSFIIHRTRTQHSAT